MASHTTLYIGETENLNARFTSHHKESCFAKSGYNAVSIHPEPDPQSTLEIEEDLVDQLDPPCND